MENEFTAKTEPLTPLEPPTNLQVVVNDDEQGILLTWEDELNEGEIVYKLHLNNMAQNVLSNTKQLHLVDLVAGVPYTAHIQAIDSTGQKDVSLLSNEVKFEIVGLIGEENPTNWIGVRLDNLTVIYEK
jgi:hypothetical protein